MSDRPQLTIPGPWVAGPDEFTWSGDKWPNARWKVTGYSTHGAPLVVALFLSEVDAKLIATCKPAPSDDVHELRRRRMGDQQIITCTVCGTNGFHGNPPADCLKRLCAQCGKLTTWEWRPVTRGTALPGTGPA